MKKTFCDVCGREVEADSPIVSPGTLQNSTLMTNIGKVRVEIRVIKTTNAGETSGYPDLCLGCIFQATNEADPRPTCIAK